MKKEGTTLVFDNLKEFVFNALESGEYELVAQEDIKGGEYGNCLLRRKPNPQ